MKTFYNLEEASDKVASKNGEVNRNKKSNRSIK